MGVRAKEGRDNKFASWPIIARNRVAGAKRRVPQSAHERTLFDRSRLSHALIRHAQKTLHSPTMQQLPGITKEYKGGMIAYARQVEGQARGYRYGCVLCVNS